jgi:hypothetical protein
MACEQWVDNSRPPDCVLGLDTLGDLGSQRSVYNTLNRTISNNCRVSLLVTQARDVTGAWDSRLRDPAYGKPLS